MSTYTSVEGDVCWGLDNPVHGRASNSNALVYTTVLALCDTGYWFEPYIFEKVVLCTDEGIWNDTLMECTGKYIEATT